MKSDYVPALRLHALTRFYDGVVSWSSAESRFRPTVVDLLAHAPGSHIVDLGCGTGSLSWMLAQRFPDRRISGLDLDERALKIAREKAIAGYDNVSFDRADARALPFADDSVDAVAACLFFHHLLPRDKVKTLKEVRRVLRSGGQLVVADWGRAHSPLSALGFMTVRILDGFSVTRDHTSDAFPARLSEAGFSDVTERAWFPAAVGTVRVWSAMKPGMN